MENGAQNKRKPSLTSSGKKNQKGTRRVSISSEPAQSESSSKWEKESSKASDKKSEGAASNKSQKTTATAANNLFRVTNPDVSDASPRASPDTKRTSLSSQAGKKPVEINYPSESEQSLSFEEGDNTYLDKSEGEDSYNLRASSSKGDLYGNYLDEYEEMDEEEEIERLEKSRSAILREMWVSISEDVRRTFDSPCRVFKLRGYHSEPDLSIDFDQKFDIKFDPKKKRKGLEKSISYEDMVSAVTKEHPSLVRGVLSELKLRAYQIDEKMETSWREIFELEKKRFSFFDELFAMGYVVDSLEVLSPPPKGEDGKPLVTGEYFIEADERHYRKKVDYGRVVFKTKHVYTGNFHDWYFQGPGRYCWQDGTIYQGEFNNGLMHGPGSIHWPDGCIYEGHFIDGIRTGWGIYSSADGHTYAGEWFEGLPHGHGKMWYDPDDDENDYYEGQWDGGLPNGIGTRQYATGDRYIGNWNQGMRNGYGIMIWLQERQVYKGSWEDGVPNGFGKHIWYLERSATNSFPTRHVYQGNWVLGKREGVGKMIYPCGSVYEGKWLNGQRHGKGMFINPAGDILVGLFRAGSILGGSEVPLHAPTYECDFGGLAEWLTARFGLHVSGTKGNTEGVLLGITKRYLPFFRLMYHRAGEFSQRYGNHGLYPAYMKKGQSHPSKPDNNQAHGWSEGAPDTSRNIRNHRDYTKQDEPDHMRGKMRKPVSLDGVDPVTRFGLWLLIRDCGDLLEEVTMAYYDKIWCETPPISFQTRHNPFEPVYLWQFLQAIIVAAVAYYVDIPRRRQAESEKRNLTAEDIAVSDTTVNAGISFDEHKRQLIARRHRARAGRLSGQVMPTGTQPATTAVKTKGIKKRKEGSGVTIAEGAKGQQKGKNEKSRAKSIMYKPSQAKALVEQGKTEGRRNSKSTYRKSKAKSLIPDVTGHEPTSGNASNGNDTADELSSLENEEDYLEGEEEDEEEEEEEEMEIPQQTPITVAQCFERFIVEKLLPCLKRDAGENLPVVPQPLPALVDMYESFKGIKNRDILKGTEFLRSILPHLLFPNPKDTLWWHRSPEPLSLSVNLDELFYSFRGKFPDAEELPIADEDFEEKLESEYLGTQAQNSETTLRLLQICKDSVEKNIEGCPEVETNPPESHLAPPVPANEIPNSTKTENDAELEEMELAAEFMQEGHPFSEGELVTEPFLWADDYKCIPVSRHYQHFENIGAHDVIDVLSALYPNLCQNQAHNEKNLHFELVFCDWLWCTSLLAKTSTEREFQEVWKSDIEPLRPLTNPQSLGVYAHYVKQIKNNPYLSLHPPPDFKPKFPLGEHRDSDDRRGVKFSFDAS